jgi:hypothetical protein
MRKLAGIVVVAGLVVVLSAGGAWAAKCPGLAKQANELLSSTSSNTDKYVKAKGLIEKGEAQHKAAQHADSAATLEEALKILRTQ